MKKFLHFSSVVFLVLVFNSCQKEIIEEEQSLNSLAEELEINDALDWINSNSSNTRSRLLIDEAYIQTLKSGNMVVIPYFLDKETGVYVRLLIAKINGEMKAKYITLIPELEYHLEKGYSTRYKDMDGRINIFDSEGDFEVGYLFEDGVYNGTIYRQSTTNRLNGKCGDCLECEGTCLEEVVVVGDSPTDEDGFDFEDFWDYKDPLPFNDDRFEPGGGEEDYYYNEPEGAGGVSSGNADKGDNDAEQGFKICNRFLQFDAIPENDNETSFTGTLLNIQVPAFHSRTRETLNAFWGAWCVTYGTSAINVNSSNSASLIFKNAWELSTDEVEVWLNAQEQNPGNIVFGNQFLYILEENLEIISGGYIKITTGGGCLGNVSNTWLKYCE